MRNRFAIALALLLTSGTHALEPIRIEGPEQGQIDFARTDGGLPKRDGVSTAVILRADRDNPDTSDGAGWTYHHHPDIAVWKGRMYVAWNSCEVDEDTWPSRELYSTSTDGKSWSKPAELFPMGASTALRMFFFRAPNGRMLAIAGLRVNLEMIREANKGPLIVREILADHTLGPVHTLRAPPASDPPVWTRPRYDQSPDAGFVEACKQLLADQMYLHQQDYGLLLDPADRNPWLNAARWGNTEQARLDAADFNRAPCFFERADGALVSIGKKRWTTVSTDGGKTWARPVQPSTLITGPGKVWGQKTPWGTYILVYNPDTYRRWPVVAVEGADGISFGNMRVLHDPLPEQRYPGKFKSKGASYFRGLSKWNNDGSVGADAAWVVYSVNKEEIWITRLAK